jgi:hypothetical protein
MKARRRGRALRRRYGHAETTPEEWRRALAEDEASLVKVRQAIALLSTGRKVMGQEHWGLKQARITEKALEATIHNKKKLLEGLR